MELRQLRYLVAVAEERHFGRAANRLFISQPSLSYAIKHLEAELGVSLFDRHPRGAELTVAGRDVVAAAREALRAAESVLGTAERHRTGQAGRVRVGFQASGAGALMTRIRTIFVDEQPGVTVEPKRYDWGGEVAALRTGEVDVAIVWRPADLSGLASRPLTQEARVIGLPTWHPLAGRSELSILDVRDIPLGWTSRAPREWVDWWAVNPRPDGSRARWGAENGNVEEMLDHAAAGAGACISPASMAAFYARPDLAWVPLVDVEPLRIDLAWDPDRVEPAARIFVDVAVSVARDEA